ncbi:hypothetical protein HPB49_018811 [Dermacentor silvarum]|uniref:Uncharacterized protein n=1 Tax=Dermacentor silvarum TaxID=543639 RepID=A0ACB8CMD1_DERSI|nr:hypothetical protein HPB49_018811 [Dermacentor silvarum]
MIPQNKCWTHPQKLVYVALSRCTNLNGLYLTNCDGDHTFYHREANLDKPMVDEFRRLESHRLHTVTQRYLAALKEQELSRVCESGSREFTLALLNVRSLSAHALDVARDPVLGKVDLLCLTETWNNGTAADSGCADAVVRRYDAAACARAVAARRAGCVDVFLKRYLPFSEELRQQRQSSLLVLDRRVCPSPYPHPCPFLISTPTSGLLTHFISPELIRVPVTIVRW